MESYPIYSDVITSDEDKALTKFKENLIKKNIKYNPETCTTNTLIRFLRARKLNIDKATEMFNKYILWRQENDVDNIRVIYLHL